MLFPFAVHPHQRTNGIEGNRMQRMNTTWWFRSVFTATGNEYARKAYWLSENNRKPHGMNSSFCMNCVGACTLGYTWDRREAEFIRIDLIELIETLSPFSLSFPLRCFENSSRKSAALCVISFWFFNLYLEKVKWYAKISTLCTWIIWKKKLKSKQQNVTRIVCVCWWWPVNLFVIWLRDARVTTENRNWTKAGEGLACTHPQPRIRIQKFIHCRVLSTLVAYRHGFSGALSELFSHAPHFSSHGERYDFRVRVCLVSFAP